MMFDAFMAFAYSACGVIVCRGFLKEGEIPAVNACAAFCEAICVQAAFWTFAYTAVLAIYEMYSLQMYLLEELKGK